MSEIGRELGFEELPPPPLFKLVGEGGEDVFEETAVGGEASTVGALFATRELAEAFSADAREFGLASLAGLRASELRDWGAVEVYATSGASHLLVISEGGTGLFFAGDVAQRAAEKAGDVPFPLYLFSDERGDAPLISVETGGRETLVAALFSSPEAAHAFRQGASHLDLPGTLATIADRDGLRRHALVARQAGASYVVVDPESGLTEAIPVEELIR